MHVLPAQARCQLYIATLSLKKTKRTFTLNLLLGSVVSHSYLGAATRECSKKVMQRVLLGEVSLVKGDAHGETPGGWLNHVTTTPSLGSK